MEEVNDLLYDDVERKYLALQNKKKKRRKKKRRTRLCIVIVILILSCLYLGSDLSKVKSIKVSGNHYYTKDEIMKKANLSYKTRYFLMPKFYMQRKLKRDDLIEKVNINKSLSGNIELKVKEVQAIGYFVENKKNYMLFSNGMEKEIKQDSLYIIANYPVIDGFNKEQRQNLAKSFSNKDNEITQEIVEMIAEITPHKESYDEHMVKFVMQDGNKIYTSYESVKLLNSYKKTLKNLKKDHVCFVMDANTKTYITENCNSFK